MKRVAIIGVGLIGASFALALRKAGFKGEIVGVSSLRSLEAGKRVGAISHGISLEEAALSADLIYLAQPIDQILDTLKVLGPIAQENCLITDAGSTKRAIVEAAAKYVASAEFLGGHPMAGKELRGAASADDSLFEGRPYVLTPLPEMQETSKKHEFQGWLERIGARVVQMNAEEHDRTVALTSHLPQILSTALAATLAGQGNDKLLEVFGPGLLEMTRLSLSSPEVWMSVLDTNRAIVTRALSAYMATLAELQKDLADDSDSANNSIEARFAIGSEFARKLRKQQCIVSTKT